MCVKVRSSKLISISLIDAALFVCFHCRQYSIKKTLVSNIDRLLAFAHGQELQCVCRTNIDKSYFIVYWIFIKVLLSGRDSRKSIAPPQGPTEPASKEMWQGEHAKKPSVTIKRSFFDCLLALFHFYFLHYDFEILGHKYRRYCTLH